MQLTEGIFGMKLVFFGVCLKNPAEPEGKKIISKTVNNFRFIFEEQHFVKGLRMSATGVPLWYVRSNLAPKSCLRTVLLT